MAVRFVRTAAATVVASILAIAGTARAEPPKTLAELQHAIKQVIDKNHVPGAGIALISNGKLLWCGGIGKADVAKNRDVACDTEFRVGSVSKTFVALAMMRLAEQGKINLDARLNSVAPELPVKNAWEASDPVRVVDVMEHTAGFDDMALSEIYNTKDDPEIPLIKVFGKFSGEIEVRWPPGTRMSYSNSGYAVAGYLVEKVSGEPWRDYVRKNVLAPLGIAPGDFVKTKANAALLAQGYHGDHQPALPYKEIYLRPAGDMKASPAEMAKLVQMFLDRGAVNGAPMLKPETIARMEFPKTGLPTAHGIRLGYGLGNYTDVQGGVLAHGHDGGIDGFLSSYRYMPEQKWGYVILINCDAAPQALGEIDNLATTFLARDFAKSKQPAVMLPKAALDKYDGYYALRAPRLKLTAFTEDLMGGFQMHAENGKLVRAGLFGHPQTLVPVGADKFRHEDEQVATSVFYSANGTMAFSDLGGARVQYAERTSPIWPYARLGLLALCLLTMASAVLYAPVWIGMKLFGFMKGVKHLSVRVVPLAAVLTFAAAFYGIAKASGELGECNFHSVLFFVGSIVFAVLSLAGLWLGVRVPRGEIRTGVRIHSLAVSIACVIIAAFLAGWHLIGLRLWAA